MKVKIERVAIIGAGLVGSGWALVFAKAGYNVNVYDPQKEIRDRFLPWATESANEFYKSGLALDPAIIINKLKICNTLEEALHGVQYIQESVFERVDVKEDVSLQIDALIGPQTIVGSSSSGIPASKFTEKCKHRENFLIVHPVNPPHLIPVVELVPAPWTNKELISQVRDFMTNVGQVPVVVNKEIDGFILNRLQGVLLNEAWSLYEKGYANLADIDATISHGLGLRWSFMGPFETIDLNAPKGITDYAERLGGLYYKMAQQTVAAPWSKEAIKRADAERREALPLDQLRKRCEWRDKKLIELKAFKIKEGL
ncbi:3-hydroxyacyl-CoA dehydrogenase [Bartonella sp. M0280]|uniref:3-hydroxyacyl-CoA dehydrogenase n=1 Tax=Bartonella apihabitans TaxID=2750929 RepID=UPI0018DD2040|nr:3-hydroxyacyl-CoA dehydrogenase [Bartonella apihabitans]MBI0168526.1 3-hydroxyacyl-CoA dehydrogenase [Bartonella apihabitans]